MPRCLAAPRSLVLGAVTSALRPPGRPAMGLLLGEGPAGEMPKFFWLCLAPWGTSPRHPVGDDVPRAGTGQGHGLPKPHLKGTGTFPSSCRWGRWVGAGGSHWARASGVLTPIETCPAPARGHALGPSTSQWPPLSLCSPLPGSTGRGSAQSHVPTAARGPTPGAATCPGAGM